MIPPLWLANILGWIVAHKRAVFIGICAAVLLFLVVFAYKGCKPKPKLNEAEIQKAEQAVKERNDEALKKILVDSDVREKQIDANVADANTQTVNAIKEAKDKYANMNTDELARELEARK